MVELMDAIFQPYQQIDDELATLNQSSLLVESLRLGMN
jgi:hypothetical protein